MSRKMLSQNWKLTLAVLVSLAVILLILVTQANAISLFNEDVTPREIQVFAESGTDVDATFVIKIGEMIADFCDDGCPLVLQNGQPESFTGDEEVYIKNGTFTITR